MALLRIQQQASPIRLEDDPFDQIAANSSGLSSLEDHRHRTDTFSLFLLSPRPVSNIVMVVSSGSVVVTQKLHNTAPAMSNIVDTYSTPTPRKKKNIAVTKEITLLNAQAVTSNDVLAVPKNLVFPTPSTPLRHLFKTPITLTIGPNAHPFPLHLEALLACSPFFTAAFNPHYAFREALTSTLHLKEINVVDFEYFTQWLYRRSLEHESLNGPHPAYFRLIKLWKVADMLQIPALKNAIIDSLASIADVTNSVPTPDDTHALFGDEVGEDTAKLGALTLDLFVWKKTGHLVNTHPDSWHERFLRSLVVRLKERGEGGGGGGGVGPGPWVDARGRCRKYHVHDQWAPVEMCGCALGREGGAAADGDARPPLRNKVRRKRRSAAPSPSMSQ